MPNAELAYKVLDQIDADPNSWVQSNWMTETDCGTAYCFAGWAVVLSGGTLEHYNGDAYVASGPKEVVGWRVEYAADQLLGIADIQLDEDLYCGLNCRRDLDRIIAAEFGPRPQAVAS